MGGGGGIISAVTEPLLGDGGAGAAGKAAVAQQSEAQRAFSEFKESADETTTSGLAAFDRTIAQQEKNLARQEKLIAQIDPTIIEASQQALKLLRGEEASSLDPIRKQRQRQKQKLLNSLREQLGPGAETSSAGIQALTAFDAETDTVLSGAQQSSLSQLGGLAGQFTASRPDALREISGLSALQQGKTGLGFQQAQGIFQARQPLLETAGAEHTKDAIKGQQTFSLGSELLGQGIGAGVTALAGSDRKFKKNITKLKDSIFRDVPTYAFEYKDENYGKGLFIGTMAQDLLKVDPNHPAVIIRPEGYFVDYGKVDRIE